MIKRTDCSMNSGWFGFLGDFFACVSRTWVIQFMGFQFKSTILGYPSFWDIPNCHCFAEWSSYSTSSKMPGIFLDGQIMHHFVLMPLFTSIPKLLFGLFLLTFCSHTHSDIVFMEQLLHRMLSVDPSTGRMLTIWNHIWLVVLMCFSPIIWKILS